MVYRPGRWYDAQRVFMTRGGGGGAASESVKKARARERRRGAGVHLGGVPRSAGINYVARGRPPVIID